MSSVYFGGSRSLSSFPQLPAVVRAVLKSGQSVHVGCQRGADALTIWQVCSRGWASSLVVFAVSPTLGTSPASVQQAAHYGARVVLGAGGTSTPIKARYLLRSIAAFQGCNQAFFFQPGSGSLAVAREAVKQGLQVFAFGDLPASIPQQAGQWVQSQFMGFQCWQWSIAQLSLF